MKAVLIVSHGSRSPETKKEVSALVSSVSSCLPGVLVDYAFLEIEPPSIPEGIDTCVTGGAIEIVVALNFLNSGRHACEDIPALVQTAQKKYPSVKFSITKPIGQHARIPNLFVDLINET
ncbi:MAG: CbiX/SirB N-terminal domain-containing protein [Candidatus Omnitrophica bacterium]|nr:CbiX/SirB N-terminal domain-containing protein [Candidatus Omnitrophota bacterium]MDE2223507.1 CbiX/SirB N-terminal domain-containing protein [Candidatus Omnitrophota bacterium]